MSLDSRKNNFKEESEPLKLFLFIGILLSIFLLCINTISDFDTGYHIRTGEFIVTHYSVPLYDFFSYTAQGARWIAHYWLADVIFYLWYLLGDFHGLILGTALIAVLTYYLIIKISLLKTHNWLLILILIIPYSFLTYELWVARPQIFSYLFTALLIYLLERWRAGGNRWLFFLPFLFLLWGNTHAGVIIGLPILLLYGGIEIIFNFNKSDILRKKLFLISALLSLIAILLNPNGYKVLTYSSIIAPVVKALGVMEWNSLFSYLNTWQAKVFLSLMIITLLISFRNIIFNFKDLKKEDWISVGLTTGAFILPLISIRHVGFFPILAFPAFIKSIDNILNRYVKIFASQSTMCLAVILMFIFVGFGIKRAFGQDLINKHLLPAGAANFIMTENLKGPMFNDAAFGGYFIWKFWPQRNVFIDGRNDVYAGEVTQDYLTIMKTDPGWENLVNNKYKIDYFVLYYQNPLYEIIRNLFISLTQLDFKLVYWDDASIIMLRNVPDNKKIIERFSYQLINPFIDPYQIPKELRFQAAEELKRALDISPDSKVLKNYLYIH